MKKKPIQINTTKMKIKKDDKVIVTTGRDKGKIGVVKKVLTEKSKFIIEGINKVKCFNKKTRIGMTEKEMPIHVSNISHIDPVDNKPTKTKYVLNGLKKELVAKRSNKVIR